MIGSLWLLLLLGNILSLRNAFPSFGWLSEINKNCSEYYLILHCGTLAFLAFRSIRTRIPVKAVMLLVSISAAMGCIYLDELRGFMIRPGIFNQSEAHASAQEAASVKALFANVYSDNIEYQKIDPVVRETNPEVVVLLESSPQWREKSSELKEYPYQAFIPQVDKIGIQVFSRRQFLEPLTDIGEDTRPIFYTSLRLSSTRQVKLLAFDLLPPLSDEALTTNKISLKRISTLARHEEAPLIVFSDMNATPYSGFYKSFLYGAKVSNAAYGYGLRRTWDMSIGWMRFTIDHVFTKGGVRTVSYDTIEIPGSDHRGIIAEFKLD